MATAMLVPPATAESTSAEPPYEESTIRWFPSRDPAGTDTQHQQAVADEQTGQIALSVDVAQELPASLALGVGSSGTEGDAYFAHTIDVPPGDHEIRVRYEDITAAVRGSEATELSSAGGYAYAWAEAYFPGTYQQACCDFDARTLACTNGCATPSTVELVLRLSNSTDQPAPARVLMAVALGARVSGEGSAHADAAAAITRITMNPYTGPERIAFLDPKPDWLLAHITAGESGALVNLESVAQMTRRGPDPVVYGLGLGGTAVEHPSTHAFYSQGDRAALSTSRELGGLDVTIQDDTTEGKSRPALWLHDRPRLDPHETLVYLVFVTGIEFDEATVRTDVLEGSAEIDIRHGTGTTPLLTTHATASGPAITAGPATSGAVRTEAATEHGIVGTFLASGFCAVCLGTSTAPGQQPQMFAAARVYTNPDFAGPAGNWTWTWNGAGLAQPTNPTQIATPAYGVWAPIGDYWTSFVPR